MLALRARVLGSRLSVVSCLAGGGNRQLTTDNAREARIKSSSVLERLRRIAPFLKPIIILALFAIALRVLQESLSRYRYRDIIAYLSSLPADQVVLAIALTLLGYLVMTGYDTLAFEYIRHPLPYRKIALASFIGYSF